jgi:hypothetical protein
VNFCGVERIICGTDDSLPSEMTYRKQVLDGDLAIFGKRGLSPVQKERILSGTAGELFPARR